jgi:hypothetical protein
MEECKKEGQRVMEGRRENKFLDGFSFFRQAARQ